MLEAGLGRKPGALAAEGVQSGGWTEPVLGALATTPHSGHLGLWGPAGAEAVGPHLKL